MQVYTYKVTGIEANISKGDIDKGTAAQKVASQVEIKLDELANEGYEFYREFLVPVKVTSGCFGSKSDKDPSLQIIMMVFRKPV